MTELLSKDHTILERPFMEFRPFGADERGEKIRDSSGVVIRSNVEYLEICISRKEGAAAAAKAVQMLCELLNARIRDSIYHVTPQLLRSEWRSYSYEFSAYLREFCKQLSGDPKFHFHMGQEKIVSPVIQVLGRPFSLPQIYRMYPHFTEKFARGVVEAGVGEVTDRSAVLRLRFTQRGLRQFGPYLRACAANVCDQSKGGLCVVPEKVHGLPRATWRDRSCIANGDEWCEWEFTWLPDVHVSGVQAFQQWVAKALDRLRRGGGHDRTALQRPHDPGTAVHGVSPVREERTR
jgi:hypothetical protein